MAKRQHGIVARTQLLALGFSSQSIKHRVAKGRLHSVRRGVYAVGRPEITRLGRWTAALLSCGPKAVLSHESAAALWQIATERPGRIDVSVPAPVDRRRPGIIVHRRVTLFAEDVTTLERIPVTTPVCTLVDIAGRLPRDRLEAAINEADKRGLTDPEALRSAIGGLTGRPGVAALREMLDRRTFTLTDSELERRFVPIAREAGLSLPQTQRQVNGFRVDFYWPDIGLVVETDGLRYHRTAAQQAKDRVRDQAQVAAGLTPLRFTHAQVRFESDHVRATLAAVAGRLLGAH
ncbi:MAG TPA: type IV toxin-antitoxin system AbiEi family antitoxin domain-containing protein [Solirubrobacterales bacterium]|nr:type IV toxin-antitoxin system AbiEi family antitoxin domain-containing protein [Solirubrobacterales bacterium]